MEEDREVKKPGQGGKFCRALWRTGNKIKNEMQKVEIFTPTFAFFTHKHDAHRCWV